MLRSTKNVAVATTTANGTAVNSSRAIAVQSVYTAEQGTRLSHHLSKPSPGFVIARPVTVSALLLLAFCPTPAHAVVLASVQATARRCLQGSDPAACERALDEAEVLQRRASARSAYPCQTLLLGLQADLIMEQLGQGRGEQALTDLGAAVRGCAGL